MNQLVIHFIQNKQYFSFTLIMFFIIYFTKIFINAPIIILKFIFAFTTDLNYHIQKCWHYEFIINLDYENY